MSAMLSQQCTAHQMLGSHMPEGEMLEWTQIVPLRPRLQQLDLIKQVNQKAAGDQCS